MATIFEELAIQKEEDLKIDYTLTDQSGTKIAVDGSLILRLIDKDGEVQYQQNFLATQTVGEYSITVSNENLEDFEVEVLNWFDIIQKTSVGVVTQVEPLSPFILTR